MRILITSNVRWWNAEAAYAATLAHVLIQAGHQVWVLTIPGSLNEAKLRCWNLPTISHIPLSSVRPGDLWQAYRQLSDFLTEHQIQIVNAHRSEGFPLLVLLRRQRKDFALIRTRGTTRPLRSGWWNRRLHQEWIEALIVPAQVIADQVSQVVTLPPQRLRVIYYPAPETHPLPAGALEKQRYAMEFDIPPHHRVLGIVGRIRSIKGQHLLLQSFARLKERYPETSLLMLYRDTTEMEPEWQAVQQALDDLNLRDSVHLCGERSDVLEIMHYVDVGVVSSVGSEVICRVAVEFFSVGTPVVAFPTGALPEIVRDRVTGCIAADHSVASLTEALAWMLEDPTRIAELGDNALRETQLRFGMDRLLTETVEVYQYGWQQMQGQPSLGEPDVRA